MKIQTGMKLMGNVKAIAGETVDFVADGDRIAFSVTICKDGRSLEIRACDSFKVNEVIYSSQLVIEPKVSNSIVLRTQTYEESCR